MNPRTCIVTREEKTPAAMIRFVLDGEDNVVPDIKRKLPGRGVWITAKREFVEEAVKKGGFSRGFKTQVKADRDLPDMIERLLAGEALSALSLARKAGLLVAGRVKVEDMVRSGKAGVVIHAIGSKGDGRRKIDTLASHMLDGDRIVEAFGIDELDRVGGGANTVHVAVAEGDLTAKVLDCVKRLVEYRAN